MGEFLKKLGSAFVERVFKNWKPTLLGFAFTAAAFAVEFAAEQLAGVPSGWAKFVGAVAVPLGAYLKSKAQTYPHAVE